MSKMTMNIEELAATLGVSVKAIYNRRSDAPPSGGFCFDRSAITGW